MARKKFFGEYLIDKGFITESDVLAALEAQRDITPTFEKMVLEMGVLGMSEIFRVLNAQAETDLSFMDVSVQQGLIDEQQAEAVWNRIDEERLPIGEMLVVQGKIEREVMQQELLKFQKMEQAYDDVKGMLRAIRLFKRLDNAALRALANITEVIEMAEDQIVVQEGDAAEYFFGVVSGSLMITKDNPQQRQDPIFIGSLAKGDVFGESAIFQGGKRTANVIACSEATTLVQIKHSEFLGFIQNFPVKSQPVLIHLINRLITKLSEGNKELTDTRNRLYAEVKPSASACAG